MSPRRLSLPPTARRPEGAAFTRTDLLVALAVVAVLAVAVAAPLRVNRDKAALARCTANLKSVGQAVIAFAGDHADAFPGAVEGQKGDSWFFYKEQVKGYAGLKGASSASDTLFACPNDRGYSDPKPFHQTARFDFNSYVFNGVLLPGVPSLAGSKLAAVRDPQRSLLVMEWTAHAPLSWHRSRTGPRNAPFYCDAQSVVTFVDGHVRLIPIYFDGYSPAYTQDPIPGYDYKYSAD